MTPILDVLQGRKAASPPVWFMRQAGRFLPEYRALRERHPFLTMCHEPGLIAETTLMPVRLLDVDAAIFFSDILIFLPALGFGLEFVEGEGPVITKPRRWTDFPSLDPEKQLKGVLEGMRQARAGLPSGKTLIGFAGGPWTILSYLAEGGSSKNFETAKALLFGEPETFVKVLDRLGESVLRFLLAQQAAGAQVVQLFDTWAGTLPYAHYEQYYLPVLYRIVEAAAKATPVIYFGLNLSPYYPLIRQLPITALGLDTPASFVRAREVFGSAFPLQGNLDPTVLLTSDTAVEAEVRRIKAEAGPNPHIFNLGHGVLPSTPVGRAITTIRAVRRTD
jgi:uroporphyrinogen decarboxylase